MSRLSRPNAFRGMLSWFSSSRLTMLVCKFCSRSSHATDSSYKLPKHPSKKIRQKKNGYYVHNLQCGSFSSARGSASGNLALPPDLQFGTSLVCLETTNTCLSWLQRVNVSDFCLLFCYTIQSLYSHSLSSCMLTLHPALSSPSDWLRATS